MSEDNNRAKFEENFNMVYNDFIKKLFEQYPDLKKNDLRLCMFLKMGLSIKEMASLLNNSVHSLQTVRYRLRKKPGIEAGDCLTATLQAM